VGTCDVGVWVGHGLGYHCNGGPPSGTLGRLINFLKDRRVRGRSEKEAISGSFISYRIPVGTTTGTFWSGELFPRCFGVSGKANTPGKRYHEIDSALRNGDNTPHISEFSTWKTLIFHGNTTCGASSGR
jgi:hypothetical protein